MSSPSVGPVESEASSSQRQGLNVGDASTSQGQRPNEDTTQLDIVTDGSKDVAISELLDKIIVGVPGRRRVEKIYVRTSAGGGKTTLSYDPKTDAPADETPLSILATKEEIESRIGTMEFLVVGLVLAKDPTKYCPKSKGPSRDKGKEKERATRGLIEAERNVLRAIVPITDFIPPGHIKYYVACKQLHGLCNMRLIKSDRVFYFSEVWAEISESVTAKNRRTLLGAACKHLAARDKTPQQRAQVTITEPGSTVSNPISVTPEMNAANVLLMQYSIYTASQDTSAIVALRKSMEDLLPDLAKKPSDEGLLAFHDFENDLQQEDATKMIDALTVTYPTLHSLDVKLICQLHLALRRTGLGDKLPYQSVVTFLRLGHDRAVAGWAAKRMDGVVKAIIHDIELFNEVNDIVGTSRTVSRIRDDPVDHGPFLEGLKVALKEIVDYFNAQSKAIREQHGGVTKHSSIEDLMGKIGNCVDKTALKVLHEQIFAIHAEQLATANTNGLRYIEGCISLIDKVLALA